MYVVSVASSCGCKWSGRVVGDGRCNILNEW
jgi:hypothetical protein